MQASTITVLSFCGTSRNFKEKLASALAQLTGLGVIKKGTPAPDTCRGSGNSQKQGRTHMTLQNLHTRKGRRGQDKLKPVLPKWLQEGFSQGRPAVYLAGAYSHPDAEVRLIHATSQSCAAAHLLRLGYPVLAPVPMGHFICEYTDLDRGFDTWGETCRTMLSVADCMVVFYSSTLADSKGVDVEFGWAATWHMPIILMRAVPVDNMLVGDPSDYTYTFERLDVPTWLKLREKGASHV